MKKRISTELCYILGILALALGTSLVTVTDLGVSMIVAPAYIVHLKLSEFFPFFTFGMAEYLLQGILLVVMCLILRKFQLSCLFSFVTAVLYGLTLDAFLVLVRFFYVETIFTKYVLLFMGMFLATLGVSFFFHSYISPEAYELFVKKLAHKYSVDLYKFKIGYDIASFVVSLLLSFALFSKLHGIGIGTVISAFLNGKLIAMWSNILEKKLAFVDSLPYKKYFDEE